MITRPRTYPVAPDSVYVWRGFKSSGMSFDQFEQFLGTVFVPACALLQPRLGLRAYLPAMVPQANKPAAVPDQTALMFWSVSSAHDEARKALAERIYQNLHGDAYDMVRSKLPEIPQSLDTMTGSLQAEQPYYLLDRASDWMMGEVYHLVGARRPDLEVQDFLTEACSWAKTFRTNPPSEVDGALICCGSDYLVAWVHTEKQGAGPQPALDELARLTLPTLCEPAFPLQIDAELWDDWPGLDLTEHACLNIHLRRPSAARAKPRSRGNHNQ